MLYRIPDPDAGNQTTTLTKGGQEKMCCRACQGYELCRAQNELREDCCPRCGYFADCMESPTEEEARMRPSSPGKRPFKGRK